jgi:hypothetical protein
LLSTAFHILGTFEGTAPCVVGSLAEAVYPGARFMCFKSSRPVTGLSASRVCPNLHAIIIPRLMGWSVLCCAASLRCRHQWYQLGNKVVIDVYAKSLPKDAVSVELTGSDSDKLRICVKAQPSSSSSSAGGAAAADEEDYVLELDLFDKVSIGVDQAAAAAAATTQQKMC